MQSASANYLTKNALAYKWPAYLVHFDGETTDYVTSRAIVSPDNALLAILKEVKGSAQSIRPEQGKASIGQRVLSILDYAGGIGIEWDRDIEWDDGIEWDRTKQWIITQLIANDAYDLQRKKTTIKAGYAGMTEADMLTDFTGWVTGIKLWANGLGYDITITDPLKWLQREIFRGSEDTPATFAGNPLNILLTILTSTGDGTNGNYDTWAEENGLGIDQTLIDVSHIEEERDHWFAGVRFDFDIRKRIKAKDFIETEIFKPCNIYPIIKGDGTFDIKVYHPPLPAAVGAVQSFDEDNIIGIPKWDQNLSEMINEVQFDYDYNAGTGDFATQDFHADLTSITNRGPGKSTLKVKSKGITTAQDGSAFIARRADRVLQRYSNGPPPKLDLKAFFSRNLSEVGDIIPVTHSKLPNLETGARGITAQLMEIIKRSADYKKGRCNFTLLATAYSGKRYAAISPAGTVLSGASQTVFTLETDQGAKFDEDWVISIFRKNMVLVTANLTITDITGDQITVGSNIASTPVAGWKMIFADYDYVTDDQRNYAFIAKDTNKVGALNDDAYLIC